MKLGDSVKAITEALHIQQCDACKVRQEKLNNLGDNLATILGFTVVKHTMTKRVPK